MDNRGGGATERPARQNASQRAFLAVVGLARRLFYNSPVHRSAPLNRLYGAVYRRFFDAGAMTTTQVGGAIFAVPVRDISMLPSLLNGTYETFELSLLAGLLTCGATMVDVGANIGIFTVLGSRLCGASGRVIAFEPEPGNFALLRDNVSRNGVTNVTLVPCAVGSQPGQASLRVERGSIGTHSLLTDKPMDVEREVVVEVTTLDARLAEVAGTIALLKVDVEGFEPFVLAGGPVTLGRTDALLLEYSRRDVNATHSLDALRRQLAGFPFLYGINERRQTLEPFSPSDFDRHDYINLLATRRACSSRGAVG